MYLLLYPQSMEYLLSSSHHCDSTAADVLASGPGVRPGCMDAPGSPWTLNLEHMRSMVTAISLLGVFI